MSFFFSSRRRHTRSLRDWSSDVYSSDLVGVEDGSQLILPDRSHLDAMWQCELRNVVEIGSHEVRSEERRVGKECRLRLSPEHLKKKEQASRMAPQVVRVKFNGERLFTTR